MEIVLLSNDLFDGSSAVFIASTGVYSGGGDAFSLFENLRRYFTRDYHRKNGKPQWLQISVVLEKLQSVIVTVTMIGNLCVPDVLRKFLGYLKFLGFLNIKN